ncbi:hypothetical protein ACJMK2_038523 [Sinanodonta woodiana]|uniref:EF-hand domain-containing protein n=1 Tax=Sinanodonta woodiana TaxID=1069815 RepID=A0ABD3WB63_SINWO
MKVGVFLLLGICIGVHANPGRPAIPDDPIARHMFLLALGNTTTGNTTTIDYVTEARLHEIFGKFDLNGDHHVSEDEFVLIWYSLSGGDQ